MQSRPCPEREEEQRGDREATGWRGEGRGRPGQAAVVRSRPRRYWPCGRLFPGRKAAVWLPERSDPRRALPGAVWRPPRAGGWQERTECTMCTVALTCAIVPQR